MHRCILRVYHAAADEPVGGDKRKFIEEILAADLEAAGGGGGHGESLVEDDEALNELMARDEAEFKRLQVRGFRLFRIDCWGFR